MRRLILSLSLFLVGCGGRATDTPEPTPTLEPTATSAPTETPVPTDASAADDTNVTADITSGGDPWTQHIVTATLTEPGRVEVQTSIVDPRGDNGSPEALQAIEVCEAVEAWLQAQGAADPTVLVLEEDGTTFVSRGIPTISEGGCTEY